ncbi:MAG: ATP-binding protein [Terriglobales bacterium]
MIATTTKSISTRLTIMNVLVSGVALLLASVAFFAYDQVTFREGLVHTLSAQAQIIGSNSVSAILFNDPQAATATLAGLKSSPNVVSAGIFTTDHRPLAQYYRDAADTIRTIPDLPSGTTETYRFGSAHVVLVRQITSQEKPIGFVYLRADLREIDQRLKRYSLIALCVFLISLLVAMGISSVFRKSVAEPIINLAATARRVSREKDYGIRATPVLQRDELTVLVDSFNEMLQEIQKRDSELQKAHDQLEQRVADRTRELVAANRELEAFSYSVSHDLRGPLDALDGFSYVLIKQYGAKLDEAARELIQDIRASGKRMVQLIDDLLNLSRVTTSLLQAKKIDLSAIARSIMDELCRTAPDRIVDFVAPPQLEGYGDAHLIRIVMENLLRNAWKYTSHHSTARIELGSIVRDRQLAYFIKDDGSGFDPRSKDRLFQPFQRLHSTSEFPGNGIGLATVRRIIQRHGGEVWGEGAVEKGATFYFTLGGTPTKF